MKRMMISICLATILIIFCFSSNAQSMIAGELKDVRIQSHYFTTQVNGKISEEEGRARSTNNPSNARYLILIIKAKVPDKIDTIAAREFTLFSRSSDNKEQRSTCMGITGARPDGSVLGNFYLTDIFNEPGVIIKGPDITFALLFFVDNYTSSYTLYRTGTSESVSFNVESRKFSVLIGTTSFPQNEVMEIRKAIENSGCSVFSANDLTNAEGITIIYMPHAETAAREISQRLGTKLNTITKLKETDLFSSYDIVILIGRDCRLNKTAL
ncbi:MAG: hypothetical protein ABII90_05765 [Bacteroidota bacterium]